MNIIKVILLLVSLVVSACPLLGQEISVPNPKLVGGPCEGCEAVLDYGDRELSATDTLPEFDETEPKLKITGTIYESDGVTPAEDVILFVHHTNREGVYPTRGDESGWARQYGYIHGWVKTGADGTYTFYTFKPGAYGGAPAHIHPVILEPNGKYYWLGSYLFADDPNLAEDDRNPQSPRGGGNGIMTLKKENGIMVGERDFILGKNIPNYK